MTGRGTDEEGNFIGCCPTSVKGPIGISLSLQKIVEIQR